MIKFTRFYFKREDWGELPSRNINMHKGCCVV